MASDIPFEHRDARADEFVQALKRIWTEDVVEFKGRYCNIPASKVGPKPVQKPRIPIYLGGFSPNTFTWIAKYADGWLPSAAGSLEYLANGVKILEERGKRENKHFEIVTLTFPEISIDSHIGPFSGTVDDIRNDLRSIKDMWVNHVIFGLTKADLDRRIEIARAIQIR